MAKFTGNLAQVTRVGLDLAKTVFQVHGVDAQGEVVVVRKLRRGDVLEFFGRLAPCVVAMEACGSAHHWGREIAALGHEVKLIPPAHVKPYVRRNKTDAADAAAICEAALRPQQRFVPLRSVENQAELMRHRVREQLVSQRTALLNALRGHLSEIGVIAPQGAQHAYRLKRLAEGDADDNGEIVVCDAVRAALAPLVKQIDALDDAIEAIDKELAAQAKADLKAKRLMTVPGSARSRQRRSQRRFATSRPSQADASSPLSSGSRRASIRPAAKNARAASARWATAICASSWWSGRPPCCITRPATTTR